MYLEAEQEQRNQEHVAHEANKLLKTNGFVHHVDDNVSFNHIIKMLLEEFDRGKFWNISVAKRSSNSLSKFCGSPL
jgi:hypothetical protein